MRFGEPWAFLALILVPLAFLGHWLHERRHARRLGRAGDPELLARMSQLGEDGGRQARFLSTFLFALGLGLVGLALARPQFGMKTEVRRGRGIDLVVALDLSRSMLARDVVPSRLERARAEIMAMVEQLAGDRVGLIGFTSVAIPLCPLTVDHAALELQLQSASPTDMPTGGTSVEGAIQEARRMLESSKQEGGKAILVLTDGEEHQGSAQAAATEAREAGIEVHVAGVGSRTGEPIPLTGDHGSGGGYLKDRQGQTVITRMNEAALRAIATVGGGVAALPGEAGGLDLGPVRAHLAKLKKAELEERTVRVYEERYRWALAPALVLLVLATLVRPRRRRARLGAPGSAAAAALALAVAPWVSGFGPFEREDPDVVAGNQRLADGDAAGALEAYDAAALRLGGDPRLALDRGLAQIAAGEIDAGLTELELAAAAEDPGLRGQAQLAIGNAKRKKGDLKGAIAAYRRAVLEAPENAAARRNLELARAMKRIQDLQPKPPPKDGDQSEPSDEPPDDSEQPDAGPRDASSQDGGGEPPPPSGDGGPPPEGQDGGSPPDPEDPSDPPDASEDGGPGTPPPGEGADAGVDAGPPPPQPGQGDGGADAGPDAGSAGAGELGDAGTGPDAGEPETPTTVIDTQDLRQILDALQQREKALKRERLMKQYGNRRVEKDW